MSEVEMLPKPLKENKYTRYFLFSKTDPQPSDYDLFVRQCTERLGAFYGYKTTRKDGRTRMVGFIVLMGHRTTRATLMQFLPNFLISPSPYNAYFESDDFDVVGNEHPFVSLKARLFY